MTVDPFDPTPFQILVRERCGLLFEGQVTDRLIQAVTTRMRACEIAAASAYARRIETDAPEFQALVNLLTINETYFFREPEQLRLLTERLVPRLLERRAATGDPAPLRIFSAGCASGEEPYSLVMALWERHGERTPALFQVLGGDIDSHALERARAGRYAGFSFRGVPDDLRRRYFDAAGNFHILKEHIRQQVRFHPFNLVDPNANPALRDFDIIFYRNVSIYFDVPTRKRIQRNLARLLRRDGLLIIGISETLANDFGILPLAEEAGLFYFIKGNPPLAGTLLDAARMPDAPPASAPPPLPPGLPEPVVVPSPPGPSAPIAPTAPAAAESLPRLITDQRFDEALRQIASQLADHPRDPTALLLRGYILLERKDFAGASAAASAVLADDDWSIDALMLLGLAAKWRGDRAGALQHFRRAVYVRPDCWPAHYYLGDLYREQGEPALARRAWQTVTRLLAGERVPDSGIRCIPLDLPPQKVRFLCEHQLARAAAPPPISAGAAL